ncbi:predicted protein [Histoplasma capsulatum var. duboisii H88]|uniref:Predicted protein n=1 Tax=Ajellomyces capsulatus (strain H88) TaxID=544711 RepID=F0UUR1_AJEC8|nr:predicted protein [Histoplasma capsulatum var. duboisii H88]
MASTLDSANKEFVPLRINPPPPSRKTPITIISWSKSRLPRFFANGTVGGLTTKKVTFPETMRSSFSRALAQASECQSEAILRKYEAQMPNETTYLVTNKRIQLILRSRIQ